MDTFASRVAGLFYGGAIAEAAAIKPEGTEFSTGTQLTLYVSDGLIEVLEWAADGQAADPPAAIWLALLRWYHNRYGAFPDGLPEPPPRRIDDHQLYAGAVDDATTAGLAETEMGLPRKPHGVDATGTDALVRSAPLGMLAQVDAAWVTNMARQVAVLTHGDWHIPVAYSLLVHHIMAGKTLLAAVTEIIEWLGTNDGEALADQLRNALQHGATDPTTAPEVLAAAIAVVADIQEQPVAPEQLFSAVVTAAINAGGNVQATALVAGQMAGGLLGNTATGTPSYLTHYLSLEETVDRWVTLTT